MHTGGIGEKRVIIGQDVYLHGLNGLHSGLK